MGQMGSVLAAALVCLIIVTCYSIALSFLKLGCPLGRMNGVTSYDPQPPTLCILGHFPATDKNIKEVFKIVTRLCFDSENRASSGNFNFLLIGGKIFLLGKLTWHHVQCHVLYKGRQPSSNLLNFNIVLKFLLSC